MIVNYTCEVLVESFQIEHLTENVDYEKKLFGSMMQAIVYFIF
jgi:hypothetical protein